MMGEGSSRCIAGEGEENKHCMHMYITQQWDTANVNGSLAPISYSALYLVPYFIANVAGNFVHSQLATVLIALA